MLKIVMLLILSSHVYMLIHFIFNNFSSYRISCTILILSQVQVAALIENVLSISLFSLTHIKNDSISPLLLDELHLSLYLLR